ncbi:MAG TPA: hypothetical protein VFZ93_08395 [Albitalea sp.]
MGLMDILQSYAARPTSTERDFEEAAPELPPDVLGEGVAQAFRSDQTPPFGDMVSQLFGRSDPQARAGLLNQLVAALGPAVLARIARGKLGHYEQMPNPGAAPGTPPPLSPVDAEAVTPEQVKEMAEEAEKRDPGVMDRIGGFYGQHPEVVKALGGAALAIALGHIANRMKR